MIPPCTDFGYAALASALVCGGVSGEAQAIDEQLHSAREEVFENSVALSAGKALLLNDLLELADECREPDWDGYGSFPVKRVVVDKVARMLRLLPVAFEAVEFSATPEGDITLDLFFSERHSLTLLVGEHSRVVFAVIDGDTEYSGTATMSEGLPPSVERALSQTAQDHALAA